MADPDRFDARIAEVVERTQQVVDTAAREATAAIVFQEVAQSLALAVQSGVDHLQSVFTLNVATTGAALARALENHEKTGHLRSVVEASQASVNAAMEELTQLAAEAAKALRDFPGSGDLGPEAASALAAAKGKGHSKEK